MPAVVSGGPDRAAGGVAAAGHRGAVHIDGESKPLGAGTPVPTRSARADA